MLVGSRDHCTMTASFLRVSATTGIGTTSAVSKGRSDGPSGKPVYGIAAAQHTTPIAPTRIVSRHPISLRWSVGSHVFR